MKKSKSPKPKSSSKTTHPKKPAPPGDSVPGLVSDEEILAEDHFAVAGREEEASSSGHRIEPIINDEEGNAEKLIEEGLHGFQHISKKQR